MPLANRCRAAMKAKMQAGTMDSWWVKKAQEVRPSERM